MKKCSTDINTGVLFFLLEAGVSAGRDFAVFCKTPHFLSGNSVHAGVSGYRLLCPCTCVSIYNEISCVLRCRASVVRWDEDYGRCSRAFK